MRPKRSRSDSEEEQIWLGGVDQTEEGSSGRSGFDGADLGRSGPKRAVWVRGGLDGAETHRDRGEIDCGSRESPRPRPSRDLTVLWIFRADQIETEERFDCFFLGAELSRRVLDRGRTCPMEPM